MRIAALYDIHGNLPALEAVLADVRRAGVDHVVIGGDIVPGPMPNESIACLRALDIPTTYIHGNGDREVLAHIDEPNAPSALPEPVRALLRWTGGELTPEHIAAMRSWRATASMVVEALGSVLFCHATPRNDTEIFTRLTPESALEPVFRDVGEPVVVCGHTHMQFDRMIGTTRVVNAGSVGMPCGDPRAGWLLLGPDVVLRQTAYDLDRAAERIRATPFPQAAGFAEQSVLHPPAEERMLAFYSRMDIAAAEKSREP